MLDWAQVSGWEVLFTFLATFVGVGFAFVLDNIFKRHQADEQAIWAARHLLNAEMRMLRSKWWEGILIAGMVRKGLHLAPIFRALGEIHPDVRSWFALNLTRVSEKAGLVPGASLNKRKEAYRHAQAMDEALALLARTRPSRSRRVRNLKNTIIE